MSTQQTLTGQVDAAKRQRVETAMSEEMEIQPLAGGRFEVKGTYEVDPDIPSCECPDHEHREIACKHIARVTLELMWNNIDRLDEQGRPPKPDVLEPDFEAVPRLLREMEHWVAWRQKLHENKDGSKRWTKVPVDVHTGGFGSSTDSDTWSTFEHVQSYVRDPSTEAVGIGFVVGEDDALVGIDFDDCRDPQTGEVDEEVQQFIDSVATYAEVSPSGTGVRAFTLGEFEDATNQADLPDGAHVEMYQWGRYLTVTGHRLNEHDVTWDEHAVESVTGWLDS